MWRRLDKMAGAREGGFDDPAGRTVGLRAAVARGRMSGMLEQIATVLTDPCLADFITELGENSDNPNEEQLQAVLPGQIDKHGLATVRLTLAASVAGEAAASVMLTRVLKHDEVVALPPAPEMAAPTVLDPRGRRGHQGPPQGRQGAQAGRGPRPSRAGRQGPQPHLTLASEPHQSRARPPSPPSQPALTADDRDRPSTRRALRRPSRCSRVGHEVAMTRRSWSSNQAFDSMPPAKPVSEPFAAHHSVARAR